MRRIIATASFDKLPGQSHGAVQEDIARSRTGWVHWKEEPLQVNPAEQDSSNREEAKPNNDGIDASLSPKADKENFRELNGSESWPRLMTSSDMTLNAYQAAARKTAVYPNAGDNLIYPVLGLVGESGELANRLKKAMRDRDGVITHDDRHGLAKELGDVLWYVSQLAHELDLSLDQIAQMNLDKLLDRQKRNKINGSGDNR